MPKLRYSGPVPRVTVTGFGHFSPGDEKDVDYLTAGAFRDERCAAEGWEVIDDVSSVEKSSGKAPKKFDKVED